MVVGHQNGDAVGHALSPLKEPRVNQRAPNPLDRA
jgi:hypothetical protein